MVKTKERRHKKDHQKVAFLFSFQSTENKIGDIGVTSLSEALKINTTLIALDLCGEDKRRRTKGIHQKFTLFHYHINRQRYWRHRCKVIE